MIRQVCLYCNKDLGSIEEPGNNQESISHGLCPKCFPRFVAGTGESLGDFLDSLPAPVFVLDQAGRMVAANTRGKQLVSKDSEGIKGCLAGEVFSCKHSKLPGGCGQAVHCKTCTIRRAVTTTFESGKPCMKLSAYVDLGDMIDMRAIRFLISTEKVGDVVLLHMDEIQPADPPDSE